MSDGPDLPPVALPRREGGARRRQRLDGIARKSLTEEVAERIVEAIALGRFLPGERLIEEELAAELGVSRFPVRGALNVLAKQGVVVLQPRRGARVLDLTDAAVRQLFEIRLDLERRAVRYTAARLQRGETSLGGLDRILERMAAAVRRRDRAGVRTADMDFHAWLYEESASDILQTLWQALQSQMRIVFGLVGNDWDDLALVLEEHRRLRDFLAADALDALDKELAGHLLDSMARRLGR